MKESTKKAGDDLIDIFSLLFYAIFWSWEYNKNDRATKIKLVKIVQV